MLIEINDPIFCKMADIKMGDVFYYKNQYFIKTLDLNYDTQPDEDGFQCTVDINCVILTTGQFFWINNNEEVIPLNNVRLIIGEEK